MDEEKTAREEEAQEEYVDIVEFVDEEGNTHSFELVDELDHKDGHYVALIPSGDNPLLVEGDGNLVILKVVDENGDEFCYAEIEDDDEFEEISDIFMDRLQDLYDFEVLDDGEDE